jgi:hypothetical protein
VLSVESKAIFLDDLLDTSQDFASGGEDAKLRDGPPLVLRLVWTLALIGRSSVQIQSCTARHVRGVQPSLVIWCHHRALVMPIFLL